jgi:hypothetical protein
MVLVFWDWSGIDELGNQRNLAKFFHPIGRMSANGSTVSKNNTQGFLRAVRDNDIVKVRKYIEAGANVNMFDNTDLPLYIAIQSNSPQMVQVLLEANAAVNTLVEAESLLYHAVSTGNTQIVERLLRAGADPEFENISKETPLFKAVENQSVKLIQVLCENNADPDHRTYGDTTPRSLAKTERVRKALDACVPERRGYKPTVRQVQSTILNLIETKGTFPIQSQKTGQCFSDSIQHALYFADGIRDYFVERAVQNYPRIKAAGELPLTKEAYLAYMNTKIQEHYTRIQKYYKNNGREYPLPIEEFLQRELPREAANLYLDATGVRFLDMFLRPLIQAPVAKKAIVARRPSLVSILSNQPTGIVCSQILNIYQITQSMFKQRAHVFATGPEGESRISENRNLAATLNEEGAGYLTDLTEYELLSELLQKIPSGKAVIKGETDVKEYTMTYLNRKNVEYATDPSTIVAVLFAVFPVGHVVRNFGAGHALSLVKTYGKWYLCDDNIGVALPCSPFKMEDLLDGQFMFRYAGTTLQYYIHDELKFQKLLREVRRNHPREFNLSKYLPEESFTYILAEVPLKRAFTPAKVFQESEVSGQGGFMDITFSRKYICWEPPAAPAAVAPIAVPALNTRLKAIAEKYGVGNNA